MSFSLKALKVKRGLSQYYDATWQSREYSEVKLGSSINIESLESGMYFLQIQGQDETTSFLKE